MTAPAGQLRACAACSEPVVPADQVCKGCGSPVFAASRRVVSVLFADLVGYTRISATLDIEQVHLLVRPLMNLLRRTCEDLGGAVPAIEGDGFMAVFGGRTTREDDPQRAVASGLAMMRLVEDRRRRSDDVPALRLAIHTGEVLVAPSWERSGFSVSGDVVNVASRLCQLAQPGVILGTAGLAALVPAGSWGLPFEVRVRNRELPVAAMRLDWRQETASRRPSTWTTPWVPRPQAQAALATAVAQGPVYLGGEAGAGKTRLVEAWAEDASRLLLRSTCPSFGRGDGTSVAEQLAAALPDDLLPSLAAEGSLDLRRLRRLRRQPVDALEGDSREACVEALADALVGLSRLLPVAVVLDDVQWADAEDVELVHHLARVLPERGVPLVLVGREEAAQPGAALVELGAMTAAEVDALVEVCLPGAPQVLRDAVVARSGGLPLYVEQSARLLVDEGAVVVRDGTTTLLEPAALGRLPIAMRLFVGARIDLLPAFPREVLAVASVIGDRVDHDLLSYLVADREALAGAVEELVSRGFLRWDTDAVQPSLRFRHQTVRDVAYESLLLRRRAEVHLAAAHWYAALPVVHLLAAEADHLEAAVALGHADCDVVRRAVAVLVSFARSVHEERTAAALEALERAVRLVESHPRCEVPTLDLEVVRAQCLELAGEEALAFAIAEQAKAQAEHDGTLAQRAEAALAHGRAGVRIEPDRARASLAEAEQLFAQLGDLAGVARVQVAETLAAHGVATSLVAFERAFGAAQRSGDARLASTMAQEVAMFVITRSRTEADRWRTTATGLLRADDVAGRARLLGAEAMLAHACGDLEPCYLLSLETLEAAEQTRSMQLALNALVLALDAAALTGRLAEADELFERAAHLARERPTRHLLVDASFARAVVLARRGRTGDALELLDELEREASQLNQGYVREAQLTRAQVLLDSGHFLEAELAAQRAVELDRELDQPVLALRSRGTRLVAVSARQGRAPISETVKFRSDARSLGATDLAGMVARWFIQQDLLEGHVDEVAEPVPHSRRVEAEALDLELEALRTGRLERLLEAAATWARLGSTVWRARALCWHTELTGTAHPEADELLAVLQAPEGLAQDFRAQVTHLRR